MHLPRENHDTLDFHGLSLDVIRETDSGLICHVESRTDHAETRMALGLARPGDRILVAGAGYGGTMLLLARKVGVENVVGYEPNPLGHRQAHTRVGVRGRGLRIEPYAVGAADADDVSFYLSDCWPASSLNVDWAPTEGREELRVRTVALGHAVHRERATALVLDIEGSEEAALATIPPGMLRWLVCELHGDDAAAERVQQICAYLRLRLRESAANPGVLIFSAAR